MSINLEGLNPNDLVQVYAFDTHGHYIGPTPAQVVQNPEGELELLLPEDCVDFAPPTDEANYYTIADDKKSWIGKPWPTTAQECVGIFLPHKDQCEWTVKMRKIFEDLTENSTEYRITRDEYDLSMTVEAIPPKTEEEEEYEQVEEELRQFDEAVASLKDRMSLAMLNSDQELITQLQEEYAQLMSE